MPHTHVQASDGSPEAALVIQDHDRDLVALMPATAPCEHHPDSIAMIAAEDSGDGESVRVMLNRLDLIALVEKGQALLEGRLQ